MIDEEEAESRTNLPETDSISIFVSNPCQILHSSLLLMLSFSVSLLDAVSHYPHLQRKDCTLVQTSVSILDHVSVSLSLSREGVSQPIVSSPLYVSRESPSFFRVAPH